jgi:Protein of unknown function (DUF732)
MVVRLLAVVAALFIGPMGGAIATAQANTSDDKFISTIKSEGITDHVSPSHAIEAAHSVCEKLGTGESPTSVANDVLNNSNMPAYHCGYFVGASIDAYCPEYRSNVSGTS